jgi:hypothetical protein
LLGIGTMLTTTAFFVKNCFPKSFIIINLRTLTEAVQEVILILKGMMSYFFDNEEGTGTEGSVTVTLKN